ncbi:hypothetical protein DFJ43DRAFT_1042891 [Lentinula guzmanii]|uniref:Uncharacterized protein n=1 Tax=Lentinula guzmanii TaxID=2804957 RepID=A0AA38MRD4_9AGAR|nr:hypothetical protein DFJ43DRAFT_1042891 [Lentinula guzmanii]
MVLLSIVLGVMTMAVPLTVHNTDIGRQSHSKRSFTSETQVNLIRRFGSKQSAVSDEVLNSQEHWYLYISTRHCFHAVQEDAKLWRVTKVHNAKRINIKKFKTFILGTIKKVDDPDETFPGPTAVALMNNLFSKIQGITGPTQFKALNGVMDFLLKEENLPKGLTYTPDPEDRTKIFLAMTDYDQYLRKFPDVPEKERYTRPTDEATDVQQAASILMGMSQRKNRRLNAGDED